MSGERPASVEVQRSTVRHVCSDIISVSPSQQVGGSSQCYDDLCVVWLSFNDDLPTEML